MIVNDHHASGSNGSNPASPPIPSSHANSGSDLFKNVASVAMFALSALVL